jgi:PTS system nitrogen regulatory IIA component
MERQRRMIPLADLLLPEHVELHPRATSQSAAIREIAALLKDDVRVLNWEELHAGMQAAAPLITEQGAPFGICLPHARTDAVSALTMSAGRFDHGLIVEGCAQPIRYLYCIGTPHALASDYLRVVGLLMRIAKDPKAEEQIRVAATPEEFLATLTRFEAKL